MTGATFVVAKTGSFVVCTHEGSADLSANVPALHIASIGIEKLIPRIEDLGVFVRLLSRSTLGSTITHLLEMKLDEDVLGALRDRLQGVEVVCFSVPEVTGNRGLGRVERPADLADANVAVVRTAFDVAETGSVLLTGAELEVNAVAYLAQHLIDLLDPDDIVASIGDAYRRPESRTARYGVFHSGPSATADIEGVLVHGAQGVWSLTVAFLPRAVEPAGADGADVRPGLRPRPPHQRPYP